MLRKVSRWIVRLFGASRFGNGPTGRRTRLLFKNVYRSILTCCCAYICNLLNRFTYCWKYDGSFKYNTENEAHNAWGIYANYNTIGYEITAWMPSKGVVFYAQTHKYYVLRIPPMAPSIWIITCMPVKINMTFVFNRELRKTRQNVNRILSCSSFVTLTLGQRIKIVIIRALVQLWWLIEPKSFMFRLFIVHFGHRHVVLHATFEQVLSKYLCKKNAFF